MTEFKNGTNKFIKILGALLTTILILTSLYYIVVDRFDVIAQIKDNTRRVNAVEKNIQEMLSDKEQLNDIQYNLKRLLEKQGLKWERLNEQ